MDEQRTDPTLERWTEAQQGVLGSLLIDPDATLGLVMDRLTPEDFDGPRRQVFRAIRKLWLQREPVDAITVLGRCGDGYRDYIRQLMDITPTAANVEAYADLCTEQSRLIGLRTLGVKLTGAADADAARAILEDAGRLLAERGRRRTWTTGELLREFYASMSEPAPKYLPWGIKALDDKLTAVPGDFIILGAYTSVGKTALALQFAWHQAARGYRVGFFSLETDRRKLIDRAVAQRARIDSEAIKHHDFSENDYREVAALVGGADKVPLHITEAAGFGVDQIRAVTVANRLQVIYIDYVQLIRGGGKGDGRAEIVGEISMALHTMAQELGVAVVGLSQITPADKSAKARRKPGTEELRESRQLSFDADVILMMSKQDPEAEGSLRWPNVVKNKVGELPSCCLKFDARHMDFSATDSRALGEWRRRRTFKDAAAEPTPFDTPQEELPL